MGGVAMDKELEETIKFIDELLADRAKFEAWANEVLDRSSRRRT
jgi:hypothetical protein